MTTTFTGPRPNHDIATGGWRTLNLTLAPFNFPPPLRVVNEKCTEGGNAFSDKSLGVWALGDLPLESRLDSGDAEPDAADMMRVNEPSRTIAVGTASV